MILSLPRGTVGWYLICRCGIFFISWSHLVVLDLKVFDLYARKTARIRNRYNQVPHLSRIPNGKVTKSQ